MSDDRDKAQFALLAMAAMLVAAFVMEQCGGMV